jgi:hypothetical protein
MEKFIIWLLPLPPLLSFFVIILFTNKNKALSHGIAVGAAGLSWLFLSAPWVWKNLASMFSLRLSTGYLPVPPG